MHRAAICVLLLLASAVACSANPEVSANQDVASTTTDQAAPRSTNEPSSIDAAQSATITCLRDTTYRAHYAETSPDDGRVFTEVFHEIGIHGLRTSHVASEQTVYTVVPQRGEPGMWQFDRDGWEFFDITPVRPLRVSWINNFVTGRRIVDAFEPGVERIIEGIPTSQYTADLAMFTDTFPDKVQDTTYSAEATSFVWWIDACGDVVQADVVVTFTGEDAAIMESLAASLRYSYRVYDVASEIVVPEPGTNEPTPIPSP